MALVKCKECNKEISDKATICPHCGAPRNLKICQYCGSTIQENSIECAICGKKISYKTKKKKNSMACTGFVIGFIAMIIDLFAILGILAVILSTIGSVQIKNRNESGMFYAILGFILGFISIGYTIYKIVNFEAAIGLTF